MTAVYGIGGGEMRPFFQQQPLPVEVSRLDTLTPVGTLPPLPESLVNMFVADDLELYIGSLTIMCPQSIRMYNNIMVENGQLRMVSFAFEYDGMGYISLYSYDPIDQKCFHTRDGGPNNYERNENSNRRIRLDVASVEKFEFDAWLASKKSSQSQ